MLRRTTEMRARAARQDGKPPGLRGRDHRSPCSILRGTLAGQTAQTGQATQVTSRKLKSTGITRELLDTVTPVWMCVALRARPEISHALPRG